MAKFPTDTLQQAQTVSTAWSQISTTLAFGTLNAAALTADITAATAVDTEISKLEAQLTDKRNLRDATYTAMWDKVKRVRKGVAANFGEDSSQFEMVGGTRLSERKARTRKATA
jgi:hypothetical protein